MKKVLPFSVKPTAPLFSKQSSADHDALTKGVRDLVKRFGFQAVLKEVAHLASDQVLLAMKRREDLVPYREAATLLDHAERTLHTIVQLHTDLSNKIDKEV